VRRRDYYRRWLVVAIRHSWGVTDTVSTVLSLVIPPLAKLVTDGESMADLAWQIPLSLFGTLFIVRVVLAPWWIHQEQERDYAALAAKSQQQFEATTQRLDAEATARHEEVMKRLTAVIAERDGAVNAVADLREKISAKLATVPDIAEAFRVLSKKMSQVADAHPSVGPPNWEAWLDFTRRLVRLTLRPSYAEELESRIRNNRAPEAYMQPRFTLSACRDFLNGWQPKLSESYINPACTLQQLDELTATQPS
jgi:hypothetical protein